MDGGIADLGVCLSHVVIGSTCLCRSFVSTRKISKRVCDGV